MKGTAQVKANETYLIYLLLFLNDLKKFVSSFPLPQLAALLVVLS